MKNVLFACLAFMAFVCSDLTTQAQSVQVENYAPCSIQVALVFNCNGNCNTQMNSFVTIPANTTQVIFPTCFGASLNGFSISYNGNTFSPYTTTYDCMGHNVYGSTFTEGCTTKKDGRINWDVLHPKLPTGDYVIEVLY